MATARTPYYGAADLDAMMAEWGVEVSLSDQWYTRGILDEADATLLQGDVALAARLMVVTIKSDTLGPLTQLKEGVNLTVDQRVYKVHSVFRQGDGATTRIVVLRT